MGSTVKTYAKREDEAQPATPQDNHFEMNGHNFDEEWLAQASKFLPNASLKNVKYEIRGPLNRRADELVTQGASVIKLNIGNPGAFGFRTPEHIVKAVIENLPKSEGYVHQKGILPARKAVAEMMEERVPGTSFNPEQIFVGNGCSELILMAMRALLSRFDEVLVPSPDYPLWTASVVIHDATPVHYPCKRENGFLPTIEDLEALVTPRTRALVIINPNNPTGVVYPEPLLQELAAFAEKYQLVLFSDEIYDEMLYEGAVHYPTARYVKNTLCCTFGGLSKIYRACGFRVGWMSFSGTTSLSLEYFNALDLLAGLRLCGNAPGQWAVEPAIKGPQSVKDLCSPGGRLYETRKAIIEGVKKSKYLYLDTEPLGAMYIFVGVNTTNLPGFDDERFAMDLLEKKHVLIAPGKSFNVTYRDHFRCTLLPDNETITDVFNRIEEVLDEYAASAVIKKTATVEEVSKIIEEKTGALSPKVIVEDGVGQNTILNGQKAWVDK
mmetsp:Transcript_24603/g.40511  ORF Transcript_24603/g.40511 Transcript_24603/m.40511 type:complete len:495 (-) Transcript_24603:497-1981(-)|eukprot:CAMPEP_0184644556 /NCGR_PEP_ID=MMETSP0308-20130426/1258_1 /TAXON_ID=38269 /ORGANISM="Gloeochaete witrockiana, Strain SAG 46.84" /LENGTH=494 /DNA_ID=CAMNT_0027073155 /DNA_START=110 /DNA_END=1594 /DNA_ORIENTATION=+